MEKLQRDIGAPALWAQGGGTSVRDHPGWIAKWLSRLEP